MRPRPLGGLSCVKRDLIVAISVNPGSNGQELWSAVEELRQDTVGNRTVRDHLEELVEYELVRKEIAGNESKYRLTEEARELLDQELEWLEAVR